MCKQTNLFGKQIEKNPNQPPASTGKKEADELLIYLTDFKADAQQKILSFLGIKTPEELNLDTFPIFLLPKPDQ
jgi:hypothetical protein